jgi:hypothetical protein
MATKVCSKCGEEKDVETGFYKGRGKCKLCCCSQQKKYSRENREKIKKKDREYAIKNRDSIKNRRREYLSKNRERTNSIHRDYYKKNKEKLSEYFKKRRLKNIDKHRAKEAAYRIKNKEKRNEYGKRYYRNNKEKILARAKIFESENKDNIRAARRQKYKENKEIIAKRRRLPVKWYSLVKIDAASRNIDFDITFEEFCEIIESNTCVYCGHDLQYIQDVLLFIREYDGSDSDCRELKRKTRGSTYVSNSLSMDRANSLRGYKLNNCVMACCICNLAKGWSIPGNIYKRIAVDTIANIVNICKEAGFEI